MKFQLPQTDDEWQGAVDAAAACRMIHDCKLYGLLEGGPLIHADRCDYILERGAEHGILPSDRAEDLAVALIEAINEEAKHAR